MGCDDTLYTIFKILLVFFYRGIKYFDRNSSKLLMFEFKKIFHISHNRSIKIAQG